MMLSRITNEELHGQLKNKAGEERKLTHQILQFIAEVDQRKLYLGMAHPSLFEYLTVEIGYSAGSAQRRIDSARLLRQVPELGGKIEEGKLNLTQVSQVQQALRLAHKQDKPRLLPSEKKTLLEKLENKSGPETELILAQEFNLPVESQIKKKIQRDSSVRLELTLTKEQMEVLEQVKALLSHTLPGGNFAQVIVHLAERYLKQRRGLTATSISTATSTSTSTSMMEVRGTRTAEVKTSDDLSPQESLPRNQKPMSASVKRTVLGRDQGCQFKDPKTGKICGSIYFAEVDHIHPKFAGGSNEASNGRWLCRPHNQFRYSHGC